MRKHLSERALHLCMALGLIKLLHGLLQVDDIDAVALGEDELCHLGVPTAGLVTEVHTCLEKLLHSCLLYTSIVTNSALSCCTNIESTTTSPAKVVIMA